MNEDKLMGLVHQAAVDIGPILTRAPVILGDRLGRYRHLAEAGPPLTSAELAAAAGRAEHYVREWLNGQAASGSITYTNRRYAPDEEQAAAFTDENSPACIIGGFQASLARGLPVGAELGAGRHRHRRPRLLQRLDPRRHRQRLDTGGHVVREHQVASGEPGRLQQQLPVRRRPGANSQLYPTKDT